MLREKRKILTILATVMIIATAMYCAAEVYVYGEVSRIGGIAYGAYHYTEEIPPSVTVYTPEQLGAIEVEDWGVENATVVHIIVPPGDEPFPLREVQPIFEYKSRFYQVSELCVGYPVPSLHPIGVVFCSAGWGLVGILWLKWRKTDETTN